MEASDKYFETLPAPMWYWKEKGTYNIYNKNTSDVLEKKFQLWKSDHTQNITHVGLLSVDFNRMISVLKGTRSERPLLRGTWFYVDGSKIMPYENDVANRLEEALQRGNFGRVEVSVKPLRFVMYSKTEGQFRQYRMTKNADPTGRIVQRGYDNLMIKDGVVQKENSAGTSKITEVQKKPVFVLAQPTLLSLPKDVQRIQNEEIDRDTPHLAQGSYGIVYTGRIRKNPEHTVVIKDIFLRDNVKSIKEWTSEIKTMSRASSPYVVKIYGYSNTDSVLTIVMEYLQRGDLYTLIHKKKGGFTPIQRLDFALQISLGLDYLHRHSIIHRDIKSMNILLSTDFICKITDFGLSKILPDGQLFNTANSGTPLWMAPEVAGGVYSFSADIYSLGLVIYEILEEKLPDWDKSQNKVVLPLDYFSRFLVQECVKADPSKRMRLEVIIDNLMDMGRTVIEGIENKFAALRQMCGGDPPSPLSSPRLGTDDVPITQSAGGVSPRGLNVDKIGSERKAPSYEKFKQLVKNNVPSQHPIAPPPDIQVTSEESPFVNAKEDLHIKVESSLRWWCLHLSASDCDAEVFDLWTELFPWEDSTAVPLSAFLTSNYYPSPVPLRPHTSNRLLSPTLERNRLATSEPVVRRTDILFPPTSASVDHNF